MAEIDVNLSENEERALKELALRTGMSESELIRDAVDKLIKQRLPNGNSGMLRARGMWRDRDDLPDFGKIRREWDRF
ncbi:MAG TPA: CopG family transcriptional regulator [Blastocatellia bacterium]|nr:CopG family transcriptional regulator [Blastocatellia bacterium]